MEKRRKLVPDDLAKEYYYLKFLYEATHKQPFDAAPPCEILLEATGFCNLRCPHCARDGMVRDKETMSLELFDKITTDVAPFKPFIAFHLQGEPLLNKNLPEFIRITKRKGMKCRLITNVTLLSKQKSLELIEAGLDYIYFSMSGGSKKTYESIHVGAKFENTLGNILDFLEAKAELKAYPVRTRTAFVLEEKTKNDLERYRHFFSQLPIDRVSVSTLFGFFGKNAEVKETLRERLKKEKVTCEFPWTYMAITADGLARGCIFDYNNECGVGDANTENVMDIWNSDRMMAFRRAHITGDFSKIRGMDRTCLECNNPCDDVNRWPADFASEAAMLFDRGHVENFLSDKDEFLRKYAFLKENRDKWLRDILDDTVMPVVCEPAGGSK